MQPLDVSLMLPFKTHYAREIKSWLRMNPTRVVTHYQIAGLLGKAYLKAATVNVAVNGFRRTGLFLYNRHIFHESEFLQEIGNLNGCEETEHALPGPSCIVQPPASIITSPDSEELACSSIIGIFFMNPSSSKKSET
jgi:hypothetical protein